MQATMQSGARDMCCSCGCALALAMVEAEQRMIEEASSDQKPARAAGAAAAGRAAAVGAGGTRGWESLKRSLKGLMGGGHCLPAASASARVL